MTCEEVQQAISASIDGEPTNVDTEHVTACPSCTAFEQGARTLRTALRFELLDDVPDVTGAVLDRLEPRRPRRRLAASIAAAAFVAGIAAGVAYTWPAGDRSDVAAASIPERVVVAQTRLASMAADLIVVDADGTRTGRLRYRAPETLDLRLGDARISVDNGSWLVSGRVATGVVGAEPFAPDAPLPLDLVLPVRAFTDAGTPAVLGVRVIDGRRAIGVRVTAAQVAALLDGFRPGGAGRAIFPADTVDLWLDEHDLVPLRVTVRAAEGIDRDRWAAARGDTAPADTVILDARLTNVVVNDARSVADLRPLALTGAQDDGFRDQTVDGPTPGWLPSGMEPWRSGRAGDISVQTWTDGRAWLKVRSTRSWRGTRVFGDIGSAVHTLHLANGTAYASENGSGIALHASGIDVIVTGSLAPTDLRRVAASLPVAGVEVPAGWDEAATTTVNELRRILDVLALPADAGFGAPAARLDGGTATLVFAGPGERGFVLATRPGRALTPPLDPDAVGVEVRGQAARWSPSRGELEWIEGGQLWSMRTATVGLAELVTLADRLEQA